MARLPNLNYNGLYWALLFIAMRGGAQWIALLKGETTAAFLPAVLLALQWGLLGVFLFVNDNFGPADNTNKEYWMYQWGTALTFVLILGTSLLFVWMGYDRLQVGIDLILVPILAVVWLWTQKRGSDGATENPA